MSCYSIKKGPNAPRISTRDSCFQFHDPSPIIPLSHCPIVPLSHCHSPTSLTSSRTRNKPGPETIPDSKQPRTRNKPGLETIPDSKQSLQKNRLIFLQGLLFWVRNGVIYTFSEILAQKNAISFARNYTRYGSPTVRLHVTDQIGDDENRSDQG